MTRIARLTLLAMALVSCDRRLKIAGVYCDSSADCPAERAECDTTAHSCYAPLPPECTTSADCHDALSPLCDATGACRACVGAYDDVECAARDSASPHCALTGQSAGRCTACQPTTSAVESTDCASSSPVCDLDGACRACAANTECASRVCEEGLCVPLGNVIYVDNAHPACTDAMHASTPDAPFCNLFEGFSSNPSASHTLVAGSTTPYSSSALLASPTVPLSMKVIGPGVDATPPATLSSEQLDVFDLQVIQGAASADVTFQGLVVQHTAMTEGAGALNCDRSSPAATVRFHIRDSKIITNSVGVISQGCDLTIDHTSFEHAFMPVAALEGSVALHHNRFLSPRQVADVRALTDFHYSGNITLGGGTGIRAKDVSQFFIENNIFAHLTVGPAVFLETSPSGTIRFNTFVDNTTPNAKPGGVDCTLAGGAITVEASLFLGNSNGMSGLPIEACSVAWSRADVLAFNTLPSNNEFLIDPFVDAANDDYHLRADALVRDVLSSAAPLASGPFPVDDFEGDARPRATTGGYDIGADQAVP